MRHKKATIYTGTGDNGTTSLIGGTRVAKNHPRVQAYGTVDELNAHLGMLSVAIYQQKSILRNRLCLTLDDIVYPQHTGAGAINVSEVGVLLAKSYQKLLVLLWNSVGSDKHGHRGAFA